MQQPVVEPDAEVSQPSPKRTYEPMHKPAHEPADQPQRR